METRTLLQIIARAWRRPAMIFTIASLFAACGYYEEGEDPETLGGRSAVTAADASWWRGLSQTARNQAVLDRAYRDVDKYVGIECKPWVQRIVPEASRGVAWVPTTAPNAYGWYWNQGRYAISMSTNIRNVQTGWIVQMRRPGPNGWGPHTAIVAGVSSNGVYWVDSNFYSTTKHNVVTLHFETFSAFEQATLENGVSHYSVYMIGGG